MILNRGYEKNYSYAKYSKISQYDDDNDENEMEENETEENGGHYNKKKHKKFNIKYLKEKFLNVENLAIVILIIILLLFIKLKKSSNELNSLNQLINKNISNYNIGNNTIQNNNETNYELYGNNNTNTSENINSTKEINVTNEFDELAKKIEEEKEKLNKIKNELINIYDQNGNINIIKFYEEHTNKSNYNLPELNSFNNIHINIGFTDDNIDLIIKHISSILYKASKNTYLHIHMMDAGNFNYDTMIKLKNMTYNINNSTEIIVYNATQVLKDFYIRADSVSKFSQEYAKLYAFKIIKDVKKILFIDGDDCIVQKDLYELYNLNMDNIYARGICEEPSIRYSMNWMDKYLYDRTHYINGGVMLINLELCQKENFYEKAVKLNNDIFYTKTEEPAQDIINVLLRKKIEFFHPKYNKINYYEKDEDKSDESKWYWWMDQTLKIGNRNNHFYSKEELIEADNDPVIIHYAWDRYLQKTIKKYEEDKQFYGNLTGIN